MRRAGPLQRGRVDGGADLAWSAGAQGSAEAGEPGKGPHGTCLVPQAGYLAESPAVQGPDQATRCRHGKGGKGFVGVGKKHAGSPEGAAHALLSGRAGGWNASVHAQCRQRKASCQGS